MLLAASLPLAEEGMNGRMMGRSFTFVGRTCSLWKCEFLRDSVKAKRDCSAVGCLIEFRGFLTEPIR